MYDYVVQLGFDKQTEKTIQKIKKYLKENQIKDKERIWLPHITIDLYNCNKQNQFLEKIDKITEKVEPIKLQCKNLNDFENETLYIEPYNKEDIIKIKEKFNQELDEYRIEKRKQIDYRPHITLCTNENVQNAYQLANKIFKPMEGIIKYIWIYNRQQQLIKEYKLGK